MATEPVNYTTLIREKALSVLALRCAQSDLDDQITVSHEEWESHNAKLLSEKKETDGLLHRAEQELRDLALAGHRVTEAKKFPGVEIKEFTEWVYEDYMAIAWGKEHGLYIKPPQLDKPAFEKFAKDNPLNFVVRRVNPRAQIAKELGKALEASNGGE